tara:strand:+ start:1569 stop:2174 length:606 start_codon:yes stop_codon:yes gene_type:complete
MKWINKNRKWIFSGIGATITIIVFELFYNNKNPISNDEIGIQINDETNISGGNFAGRDIIINQSDTDKLIELLNFRAIEINDKLGEFYYHTDIDQYLIEFNLLHKKHIKALNEKNLVLANEIIYKIHKLSNNIEQNEFWIRHDKETPNLQYELTEDAFTRGALICKYIVDDFQSYSKKYPLLKSKYSKKDYNIYNVILQSN